jgi:hypothetical protein
MATTSHDAHRSDAEWSPEMRDILTPPETAEKHVSFQGAELGADYFSACVTQIALEQQKCGVGATKMWWRWMEMPAAGRRCGRRLASQRA